MPDRLPDAFDFELAEQAIDTAALRLSMADARAGAFVAFEGWVRNHHEGRAVSGLDYDAYHELALAEGRRILAELKAQGEVFDARCVHRVGALQLGELAVWVGVCAAHRDAAFAACRHIIDAIKADVPIWKREHYSDADAAWLHPH